MLRQFLLFLFNNSRNNINFCLFSFLFLILFAQNTLADSLRSTRVSVQEQKRIENLVHKVNSGKVQPDLIKAMIRKESEFKENAVSKTGAQGLMQILPSTARSVCPSYYNNNSYKSASNNIKCGEIYMSYLQKRVKYMLKKAGLIANDDNDPLLTKLTLAAYNWGEGNIQKSIRALPAEQIEWQNLHIPPHVRRYASKILYYKSLY